MYIYFQTTILNLIFKFNKIIYCFATGLWQFEILKLNQKNIVDLLYILSIFSGIIGFNLHVI